MPPSKIEWALGKNRHGQNLRLVYEKAANNYTLYRDAMNQRDDKVFIGGLTLENMQAITAAITEKTP